MIAFNCPKCGRKHTARDQNAGRRGFCNCGAVMIVPAAASAKESDGPELIGDIDLHSAERHARNLKIGIATTATAIILAVLSALYFHNKWERDNRAQLLALKAQAEAFVQAKEYEKAKGEHDKLFALLGDRKLSDSGLRSEIESARLTATENNKKVDVILAKRAAAEQANQARQAAAESSRRWAEVAAARSARSDTVRLLVSAGVSQYFAETIADQPPGANKLKFDEIRDGMSYSEVAWIIIGESGELSASGEDVKIYTWSQKGTLGGNMSVTFQSDKVVSKAQFGLE